MQKDSLEKMLRNAIKISVKNHGNLYIYISASYQKCSVTFLKKGQTFLTVKIPKFKGKMFGPFKKEEFNNQSNEMTFYTADFKLLTFKFLEMTNP